jgi:type IV pilus assembly protein PilQ
VQSLLSKIDVAVRQVVIEARIVEANDSFGKSIGVRLGGADLRGVNGGDAGYSVGGGNRVAIGGSYDAVSNSTGNFGSTASGAFSNFVNMPMTLPSGASASAVSSLALTLFNPTANRLLSLEIQAMEAEGKGTIVSSPRLMTADQVTAIIEQGKEIPYTVIGTNGISTTAYKKAVMKLEVTPQITPDGNVILDLQINKDSQGSPIASGVIIDTKAIKTQAIVQNGGTVMLGGIFESTENNSETKVPLLGDIPYLGNLFKSRSTDTSRKETLIFITPRILTSTESGN